MLFNDDVEKDLESNIERDLTALLKEQEKFETLQLTVVYKIFQSAHKEILG